MATLESALLQQLNQLSAPELRRLLAEHLTRQKLGLYWERDAIAHDRALNADVVRADAALAGNQRKHQRRGAQGEALPGGFWQGAVFDAGRQPAALG